MGLLSLAREVLGSASLAEIEIAAEADMITLVPNCVRDHTNQILSKGRRDVTSLPKPLM